MTASFFIVLNTATGAFTAHTITDETFAAFEAGDVGGPELSGWRVSGINDVSKVKFTGVTAADFVRSLLGEAPQRFKTSAQITERVWDALNQAAARGEIVAFSGAAAKPAKPAKAEKPAKEPKPAKAEKPAKEPKPAKTPKEPKEPKQRKLRSALNLAPKDKLYACRAGTKQAALIDALAKPNGATMADLRAATDKVKFGAAWRDASIRSALSHDVNTVKGYGIRTEKRDEEPVFFLVYPKGITAPLPHK